MQFLLAIILIMLFKGTILIFYILMESYGQYA